MGSSEVGIENTVMAIREELMNYFKGSCIERFTYDSNIYWQSKSEEQRNFRYQRQAAEEANTCELMLGGLPLLTVRHAPDTITFNETILNRSPQLKAVYRRLDKFMADYLMGVKVKRENKEVIYAN